MRDSIHWNATVRIVQKMRELYAAREADGRKCVSTISDNRQLANFYPAAYPAKKENR